MKNPSRIVVGLDFDASSDTLTEGSRDAALHAIWLAQVTGARIDFVHSTYRSAEDHGAGLVPRSVRNAQLATLYGPGAARPPQIIETDERIGLALVRRVLQGENDLVVVAKRNCSRTEDRWLGSVSQELLRTCPCPVWVIKPGQPMQHRAIVAATDLTRVGDRAVELGAMIAKAQACTLHIVHTWQLPLDLQMNHSRIGDERFAKEVERIEQAARRHIEELEAVKGLEKKKLHLARGVPSRYIQQVASAVEPDLAVLGTVSRGGIAGFLIGNTAEKIVYQLDCSLLAIKPENFVCPVKIPGVERSPASASRA